MLVVAAAGKSLLEKILCKLEFWLNYKSGFIIIIIISIYSLILLFLSYLTISHNSHMWEDDALRLVISYSSPFKKKNKKKKKMIFQICQGAGLSPEYKLFY